MKHLYTTLLLLITIHLGAQDVYQTQYFNNPSTVNPAYTGVMDAQYRLGLNFRSQWFNPLNSNEFRTASFNGEMKSHIANADYYGLGLNIGSDQSGSSRFQQTFIYGTASYIKQMSHNKYSDLYLIGGLKFGGVQYRIASDRFWFGNQFNLTNLNVDRALPSNETDQLINSVDSGLLPDLGLGISAYQTSKKYDLYGGIALDHLTRPQINIGTNRENLNMKWSINAGVNYKLTNYTELLTAALYIWQGNHRMLLPSLQYRVTTLDDDDIAFRIGAMSKVVSTTNFVAIESWSALTMLEYHNFFFGLSFDITTSPLMAYNNNNGGFELSMSYKFAQVQKKQPINCPKF